MQNKHILLSSSILPGWGTGTRIILKRHLEMLEKKGLHISVVVPESYLKLTKDFPKTWNVVFRTRRIGAVAPPALGPEWGGSVLMGA